MDEIIIEDAEFNCFIGVPDQERSHAQPILVSITIGLDTRQAGLKDSVALSVDYAQIYRTLSSCCGNRISYQTIEALAEKFARQIWEKHLHSPDYEASYVKVKVKKPPSFEKY